MYFNDTHFCGVLAMYRLLQDHDPAREYAAEVLLNQFIRPLVTGYLLRHKYRFGCEADEEEAITHLSNCVFMRLSKFEPARANSFSFMTTCCANEARALWTQGVKQLRLKDAVADRLEEQATDRPRAGSERKWVHY